MKIKSPALYRKMHQDNILSLPPQTTIHLDYTNTLNTITGKHHGIDVYFSPLEHATNTGSVLSYGTITAGQ